jgi:hypothetical protein
MLGNPLYVRTYVLCMVSLPTISHISRRESYTATFRFTA